MATTPSPLVLFLLLSLQLVALSSGQIVFGVSLTLNDSSACSELGDSAMESGAGAMESGAAVGMSDGIITNSEASAEVIDLIQSYNLTVNISDPDVVSLSCFNGTLNAAINTSHQLAFLCKLSSLINNSHPPSQHFLNYTVSSIVIKLNSSCLPEADNFLTSLIVAMSVSGGVALVIIILLCVFLMICRAVIESKRSKQKNRHKSEASEMVKLNQYDYSGSHAQATVDHKAKPQVEAQSMDNYEALPATDIQQNLITTVEVVASPPIANQVASPPGPPPPPAPPPPVIGGARNANESNTNSSLSQALVPPPPAPPPPILGGARNDDKPHSKLSRSQLAATVAAAPSPPPPPPPPPVPSANRKAHAVPVPIVEEVYDSSDAIMNFNAGHPTASTVQMVDQFEEIYDAGVPSLHEPSAVTKSLDEVQRMLLQNMSEDYGGDEYEEVDPTMMHDDDDEAGDEYTDMNFSLDYQNVDPPIGRIPSNNDLYV